MDKPKPISLNENVLMIFYFWISLLGISVVCFTGEIISVKGNQKVFFKFGVVFYFKNSYFYNSFIIKVESCYKASTFHHFKKHQRFPRHAFYLWLSIKCHISFEECADCKQTRECLDL